MTSELVQQAAATTSLMLIGVLIFLGLSLSFSYIAQQETVLTAEVAKGFCPGQCGFNGATCKVFSSSAGRLAPSEGCRGKVLLSRTIHECTCPTA